MRKLVFSLVILSLLSFVNVLAQANELPLGEPIEGTLTEDQLVMDYLFSANEGDRLTISMSSSEFDTFLWVENSKGKVVVSNDDAKGSLNSHIEAFIVPEDDDYILSISSSDGTEVGDYVLIFNQTKLQILNYGDSITGNIDETTSEGVYQFEGKQGDMITVKMTSNTIDSFVTLSNSEYEVMSDDNNGGGLNAMIGAFPLPTTDTYTIRANTYSIESYGEFTVSLDLVEASPITLNEAIKGRMSNEALYYSVNLESGSLLSIRVISDDGLLDTMLNLQNSLYGYSIGYDDDSSYGYDPEINDLFIYETGQYIITVIPAVPNTEGDFELRVITKPTGVLECDSSELLSFNQKTFQFIYTMDIEAKQNATFTFFGDTSSLGSLYSVYTLNDVYQPVDFINDLDGQTSVEIKSSKAGLLNINITDYAFRLHNFRLEVSCS